MQVPPPVAVHSSGVTGDVRIYHGVGSDVLHNQRDVVVYLPPGYRDDPQKRYPVLYLQDGQNLFDPSTAFNGHEWHLDETAESLIRSRQMQPCIMVGVYNTPDRMEEYTPVSDPDEPGGKADAYESFLTRELKPYIDSHYRTEPDAAHTGIMGSSLGALLALHAGFTHPEVFGLVGALSPSLWWAHQWMNDFVAHQAGPGPQKIWLDIGTNEGDDPQGNVDNTRRFEHTLEAKGYQPGRSLGYEEIPGAQHNEDAWAARSDQVLEFLFPTATPDR
ncbi:MAG: alpha/beta hydrolase [Candidatus Xenobia bacterium]